MRIVTLEEHFVVPSLIEQHGLEPRFEQLKPYQRVALGDLGDQRLAAMDAGDVTVQVLSAIEPGADLLNGAEGIDFARRTNDTLAHAVRQHPRRFAGFCHLPMRSPEAAADELERSVRELSFHGALINGTTEDLFLDDERFAPILARAEKLDVPIYIHPSLPPDPVKRVYYDRLPQERGFLLSMAGFGWHVEVGVHVLRMVLADTFKKHPRLKIIIGHMGETLPFMLDRADQVFAGLGVKKTVLEHVWITTSGFFTLPPFENALAIFGPDRILYSVDYPFSDPKEGRAFLDKIPHAHRHKIAHANADALLRLDVASK